MTSPDEPTSPDDAPVVEPALGEVERVPLKVVPIYVHPIEDEPPVEETVPEEPAPKPRTVAFALAAVVLAMGTIGVHIAGIVVATAGDFAAGTLLAYIAVGLSGLAVVIGAVAIVRRRARVWGIVAVVAGVLANPLVLLAVLRFLSGLQTG